MKSTLIIAQQFGASLDIDDFATTHSLLSADCEYIIESVIIEGPDAICKSYEANMIEGRRKLDHLTWGRSWIEPIDDCTFKVHFTDFMEHSGMKHTFRCAQLLTVEDGRIKRIEHLSDAMEEKALQHYYREVGLV